MVLLKKIIRYSFHWFTLLAILIGVGLSLLFLISKIPESKISANLKKSSIYLKDGPQIALPFQLKRDNFTEAIMLHIAKEIDTEAPIRSIMLNKFYWAKSPQHDLYHNITHGHNNMNEIHYFRYWHGYLVVLRPLLTITDYQGIIYINYAIFTVILTFLLCLIKREFKLPIMIAFIVSLLYSSVFFIPQCIQFSTTFYIAMFSCILAISFPWQRWGLLPLSCFFVAIGALTSYADFLVTPIVTLGYPLTFLLLKESNRSKQLENIIILAIAWFFGYVGMWAAKWILCAVFTECDVKSVVCKTLIQRSIGGTILNFKMIISSLLWFLPDIGKIVYGILFVSACIILVLLVRLLYKHNRKAFMQHIAYIIVAILPLGWLIIAFNHTTGHMWFTYRIGGVSIFAFLVFAMKVRTSSLRVHQLTKISLFQNDGCAK